MNKIMGTDPSCARDPPLKRLHASSYRSSSNQIECQVEALLAVAGAMPFCHRAVMSRGSSARVSSRARSAAAVSPDLRKAMLEEITGVQVVCICPQAALKVLTAVSSSGCSIASARAKYAGARQLLPRRLIERVVCLFVSTLVPASSPRL